MPGWVKALFQEGLSIGTKNWLLNPHFCASKSESLQLLLGCIYQNDNFFTPIPCTYTSSPLDGVARNYLLSTWISKFMQFIISGSIFSYLLIPEEKIKTIWSELESNPGPFASQATSLITKPCLLGLPKRKVIATGLRLVWQFQSWEMWFCGCICFPNAIFKSILTSC